MNFTESQRKRYLMAIALLILAIVLACAWSLWRTRPRTGAVPETTAAPDAEQLCRAARKEKPV